MERIYSKTTLKKRRFTIGVLLIIAVFLLGSIGRKISGVFSWDGAGRSEFFVYSKNNSAGLSEKVFTTVLDLAAPAIFKFQEQKEGEAKEPVPIWIRVLAPPIFAYTWKAEENRAFLETGSKEPGVVLAQNQSQGVQAESATEQAADNESQAVHILVSGADALSLLQENIFQESSAFSTEESSGLLQEAANSQENSVAVSLGEWKNRQPLKSYDLSVYYQNMIQLIKDFYIIDSSTSADPVLLDIDKLTGLDCILDKSDPGPQILIYHSHSQEGFADSVAGDVNTTIVGAGAKLAEHLEEYGYQVLHHTGVYDMPSRDNAYSNALPGVEKVLADNPTIQVVIDLHRDAVAEGTKLVQEIDGKSYARFMFFNGICRSTKGPITYLNNPYLQDNMSFSFQAQVVAESYFPGITRKIYLKAWRYNMHFRPRNMLIELGAQTNTVEEVMNTTEILAFVIDKVLSGQ